MRQPSGGLPFCNGSSITPAPAGPEFTKSTATNSAYLFLSAHNESFFVASSYLTREPARHSAAGRAGDRASRTCPTSPSASATSGA